MGKQKVFRKEQLKFMIFSFISFTVIFTIFGVIIFSQVKSTLFTQTDEELLSFKAKVSDVLPEEDHRPPRFDDNDGPQNPNERKGPNNPNPRIMMLHWNNEGEIINQNEIGTTIYESYFQDYELDKENVNAITNMTINDLYNFRYIVFEDHTEGDEVEYVQLLINTDPEQTILANFGKLIIICSSIFIILSISASYILSKRMMKPIIKSWNKQTEFVENASHELRTPLTIIQNKLELLLTAPQEKIMNKFENIALSLSETRRLSKLTSDLLTLARADSAESQLNKQPVNVDNFIKKVCNPYIDIAESQEKHVWLKLNSKIEIEADEQRLHQLLVILLDNALKYTAEQDSIGVKTYNEDHKVVIEITDTGIGISKQNMKYIFDRFYREDRARSRETGGSGLGLSIAQWIVTQHNGTISVSENQHKGTTFIVKLPKK
ncbi:sensor histidine kinase [Metabacillus endolithicus]|uniref:histidine kinase n=1 Tax=Metabacillus endolithicus TaxID=1535204 RepID=A0ABW5BXF6_9BACI|nr:ATP-binding protein [Metabacillus endolithicus]UPG62707.1 HAMP domain-containing histidine kinase [Metabacillus endolithicus]